MARVNYGLERAERNRAKDKKKQAKLARRDEDAAKRRELKDAEPPPPLRPDGTS